MTWPFPARLAAAFAGCGARVEALCPGASPLALSRHTARRHRFHPLAPAASLARAVEQAKPALVIPCDDMAAGLVCPAPGRQEFLTRAAGAGAPIAESIAVPDEAALESVLAKLGLPLVLKNDNSWGGEGVRIAASLGEARAAFRALRQPTRLRDGLRALRRRQSWLLTRALRAAAPRISAQRFIPGHPATSAMACWRGELVAALHFDVLTAAGATGPSSVVARSDCSRMEDSARRIARAFHLSGLFGLDYIRDPAGGIHLLEMNARATPTAHLALTRDLPAALLGAAGLGGWPRPPVTEAREIALFPGEWLRDPASPWLKTAFHDVPWDDPAVMRSLIKDAPPQAAQALLAAVPAPALTAKTALFRA